MTIDATIMENVKKIELANVFLVGMENSALFLAVQTIVLLEANVNKWKGKIGNAFASLVSQEKIVIHKKRPSVKIMKTTTMVSFLDDK